MSDKRQSTPPSSASSQKTVTEKISRQESRRLDAQRNPRRNIWFGLGMFGLVGWSVAVPTLLGAAVGLWIDSNTNERRSWTLMLMLGGLALGCINAWRWIKDESEPKS